MARDSPAKLVESRYLSSAVKNEVVAKAIIHLVRIEKG